MILNIGGGRLGVSLPQRLSHPLFFLFSLPLFVFNLLSLPLLMDQMMMVRADHEQKRENNLSVYVVYMGAAPTLTSTNSYQQTAGTSREHHIQLLASFLLANREEQEQIHLVNRRPRRRHQQNYLLAEAERRLVHSYRHGFSGFAARLSKEEAEAIQQRGGIVSVFEDPVLELHTTRSWDFLQLQTDLIINQHDHHRYGTITPTTTTDRRHMIHSPSDSSPSSNEADTIIGILDTGIWPESESFNDKGMGPVPSRWKGVCMQGHNFIAASNCNRKVIGARYYNDTSSSRKVHPLEETPRDEVGHGTHTASTAAGASVTGASYYGLAAGNAKGGSPGSRLAIYKVCTPDGCHGSSILAAFDDAIGDGVDVLSLSLGASSFLRPDFSSDPIAIGAFHAVQKGITVVCSAGNDGPTSKTVVNAAPWILTVAATTIDRDFESAIVLGDSVGGSANKVIKGEAINFSNLQKSPIYPIILGGSAKSSASSSDDDARNCNPDSLDGKKIKGKIVLCEHLDSSYSKKEKMEEVKKIGGIGLVLTDNLERKVAFPYGSFPLTVVSSQEAAEILSYINSTRNPVATILPTAAVTNYKPAPAVAYFSSRGPSLQTSNLLKPDIAAPGVNILAAWMGTNDTSEAPEGQKPSQFNLLSGTSMSCPHVSGIAATIKSRNPSWSPSAIRSAIMTTATQTNNEKTQLATDSNSVATPYDYGAGEVSPSEALQPGLIYEINTDDYLLFLCNYGYQVSDIKLISNVTDGFNCPKNSSKDLISELNYPSIAISKFNGKESKNVSRTVTNVGAEDETTYTATVNSPREMDVKVVPSKLQFSKSSKKLSYQVIFSATSSSSSVKDDLFGLITWSNGKHKVRTTFVVASA